MSFWHQFYTHPEARLSLTLETPISSTLGYTDLGAGLGAALDLFFPCEAPATSYCTAGSSASGCQASLSACGLPSGTAAGGFELHAAQVEGGKDGLFFLGSSGRQANPWGSSTSFQCVTPPVTRAGLLSGRGTPGTCDGAFFQDLNALWCPTCPKPAKNPDDAMASADKKASIALRDFKAGRISRSVALLALEGVKGDLPPKLFAQMGAAIRTTQDPGGGDTDSARAKASAIADKVKAGTITIDQGTQELDDLPLTRSEHDEISDSLIGPDSGGDV